MRALGVGVLGSCCAACISLSSEPSGPAEQDASLPEAGGTLLATIPTPVDLAVDTQAAFVLGAPPTSTSWAIFRIPLDGGAAVTLATSPSPTALAIDDAAVYWIDGTDADAGSVFRIAKDGGAVTALATASSPEYVALDDAFVYWADGYGAVWRVAKEGGGTPTQLASATNEAPVSLAVDGSYAYVGLDPHHGGDGGLLRVPKDGGATQQIIGSLLNPSAIVLDDAGVYVAAGVFSDAGALVPVIDRYDKASGRTMVVASQGPIYGMALTGQRLYFSTWSPPDSVDVVSSAGGTPSTLATNLRAPTAIAIAGTDLYWIDLGPPGKAGDLRVLRGAARP